MKSHYIVKINFRGGIISPGDLYNIMAVSSAHSIRTVRFGLRQQLYISVAEQLLLPFTGELKRLDIFFEVDTDQYPNIISSYPAEEVFINDTWLSEGVYKDILDGIDYTPELKINISDSNQSFTPMLTGNINWVASASAPHFWHLFIRFPKTNIIYEWSHLVYTNDVANLSKEVEKIILQHKYKFFDNANANGDDLFKLVIKEKYILKPAEKPAVLPSFNLPYYEGLNRYNNKYWLGVYRRDELFNVDFLKALCQLCLDTKIGQLCSTPWKTIIVKGIEDKDKPTWNQLLETYQVNVRHAANELNFQVEDNSIGAINIKSHLVKALGNEDMRTFGLCIGIKTKKKSEIFSSILVRRKALINLFGVEFFHVYDILCAHDFNPNERTDFVFSRNNPKGLLAEQLRRSVIEFYKYKANIQEKSERPVLQKKEADVLMKEELVYQCAHCMTIYDEKTGEPENGIGAGTLFNNLPVNYCCPLCESAKEDFVAIEKSKLLSVLQ